KQDPRRPPPQLQPATHRPCYSFFFRNTLSTDLYTLSLHDALPIYFGVTHMNARRQRARAHKLPDRNVRGDGDGTEPRAVRAGFRSEEHTSELQSQSNLVCRLLLEKKNLQSSYHNHIAIAAKRHFVD